jgi:hypothetical protein
MEIADVAKSGRLQTVPRELDQAGAEITALCGGWARNIDVRLDSYETALQLDSAVAEWISVAMGSHRYIMEDGPELPRVPGPHVEKGGEVLERMHADGYTTLEEAKIRKGRMPIFSSGSTVKSCRHCFERPPDRTNVMTILLRISEPHSAVESKDRDVTIALYAEISRLLPISLLGDSLLRR